MKKKLLALLLCVALTFSITGCGSKEDTKSEQTTNNTEKQNSQNSNESESKNESSNAKQQDLDLTKITNLEKAEANYKNVETYYVVTETTKKPMIIVKNNNDKTLAGYATMVLYNKDNEIIRTCYREEFDSISANSVAVHDISSACSYTLPDSYDHAELKDIGFEHYDNTDDVIKKLKIDNIDFDYDNKKIIYNYSTTHQTEKNIKGNITTFFLKDNKIVELKVGGADLYQKTSSTREIDIPEVDFDSYVSFVSEGYVIH